MKRNFFADILIILLVFTTLFGSFASCSDLFDDDSNDTKIQEFQQQGNLSEGVNKGVFTVTTNFSSTNSNSESMRSAAPASFSGANAGMVFAAALYSSSQTFADSMLVGGTYDATGNSASFSFPTPSVTTGLTLEIFAFKSGTTEFSAANSLLSGKIENVSVVSNSISVNATLYPNTSSTEKGKINLTFSIPAGYSLEASCTTIADLNSCISTSAGVYSLVVSNITAGNHLITFSLVKNSQVVYVWTENVNVFPGMTTDAWIGGSISGTSREITEETVATTFYVCGNDFTWYATAMANGLDINTTVPEGSLTNPFNSLQDAVNKVIASNRNSPYTILIDGTVSTDANKNVLNFDTLGASTNLEIVIKSLGSTKATLKGNGANVVSLNNKSGLNLTLENLIIDGAKGEGKKSIGLYAYESEVTLNNCEISNCDSPEVMFIVFGYGGGIYSELATINLNNCTLTENEAKKGGAIWAKDTTLNINGCTINNNNAPQAGNGIYGIDNVIITLFGACNISDNIYYSTNPISVETSAGKPFALASGAGKVPITPDGFNTGDVIVTALPNAFTVTNSGYKVDANGKLAEDNRVVSTSEAKTLIENATPGEKLVLDVEIDSEYGLTEISTKLTENSSKLTGGVKLTINGTSTNNTIGNDLFTSMDFIKEVEIKGMTSIGAGAFSGCGITSLVLDEGLIEIGERAFSNCASITSITLPKSLEKIARYAFQNCTSLQDMIFKNPSNWYVDSSGYNYTTLITDIGDSGKAAKYFNENSSSYKDYYWSRKKSTTMTVAEAKALLDEVIDGTITDAEIDIEVTVNTVGDLQDLTGKIYTIGYIGKPTLINLTMTESSTITEIPSRSPYYFRNCANLKSLVIPNSVTRIESSAFKTDSGSNLTSVEFSNTSNWYATTNSNYTGGEAINVTTPTTNATNFKSNSITGWYGKYLYRRLSSSEATTLIENATGYASFTVSVRDSDGLAEVVESLKKLNNNDEVLGVDLVLTDGIGEIPREAFKNCQKLTSVVIPESVKTIGSWAFYNCKTLQTITLPDGLTEIKDHAFYYCTSLRTIEIPNTVTSIGDAAFSGAGLTSTAAAPFIIPSSVVKIGNYVFSGNYSLDAVKFENDSGWYCTSNSQYTGGTPITNLSNYSSNASNFKSLDDWLEKYLYRNP